jgi:hypothetical protein
LRNPCSNETGIELTDEVKEYVLKNHKYIPPKFDKQPKTINQTVNMYNVFNNLVTQMDFEQKVNLLMNYQNRKLIDFEDGLNDHFEHRLKKLEQDKYPNGYYLNEDGLLKLIDNVTKIDKDNIEKMNVLFDKTVRRLKLYSCGDWDSYLEDIGCKEVVKLVKSYFLDTYENYLIRNLHCDDTSQNRVKLREHLEIYYRFISIFELDPAITNLTDEEILGHVLIEDNEFYLANTYSKLFYDQKKEVKIGDKNKCKRKIANIIKENTQHNLSQLNRTILELLRADSDFKQQLVKFKEGFSE